ncbi:glyoxylase I family protein [Catalinimonas alkaloidigena]|uniref:VOC family protein n=1 Tax=Catalinimonas alkaloidigena TaxID=1075417 RepID=UPI002406B9FC|nr:VOC family protein [Catalinimonas alkaloidigena]MDF9797495.1 glyoxylase I family protein [Catalinimonas alkaloidigena]
MSNFLKSIDHPAVAAQDVDKLADWYCNVLGYEKYYRDDKPVWMLKAPDASLIEIMPIDETPRPARTTWTPGWSHLALRVNNIDQAIQELDKHHVQWMGEMVEAIGGGKVRSFQDPEGNMLQVVERIFM